MSYATKDSLASVQVFPPRTGFEETGPLIAGDASASHTFSYTVLTSHMALQVPLSPVQQRMSSSYRELLTITNTLEIKGELLRSHSHLVSCITWLTDSWVLTRWMVSGSRKPWVQARIFFLLQLCRHLRITLRVIWVPRDFEFLALADAGSKFIENDTDQWGPDDATFAILEALFGKFSLDPFAMPSNARCSTYFTPIPAVGSSGVDAFSQSWAHHHVYAVPPVTAIPATVAHISTQICSGTLLVPFWTSHRLWAHISREGCLPHPLFHAVHTMQAHFRASNSNQQIFSGSVTFPCLALAWDTTKQHQPLHNCLFAEGSCPNRDHGIHPAQTPAPYAVTPP